MAEPELLTLLSEWYNWWDTTEDAPAKMPDRLHNRTLVTLLKAGLIDDDAHAHAPTPLPPAGQPEWVRHRQNGRDELEAARNAKEAQTKPEPLPRPGDVSVPGKPLEITRSHPIGATKTARHVVDPPPSLPPIGETRDDTDDRWEADDREATGRCRHCGSGIPAERCDCYPARAARGDVGG